VSESPTTTGQYIYCIISGGEPREFSRPGIGGRGDPVHTLAFSDLAAVVSDSPEVEYERSRACMIAHTLVLEEVMQEGAILPVRFGTVASSAEAVRAQVLERRYEELTGLLADMEGRAEVGLKAVWPEGIIFQEIVREAPPAMRKLQEKIQGRPPAETYFERMKLGEMIESAMNQKRDADAGKLMARLGPLAEQHKLNALFMDRMVLNGAFLVHRDRQAEFDAAVQELDSEMGSRVTFKYVGPVPPYNFVSIVIRWED
jgi:hypothetical protein